MQKEFRKSQKLMGNWFEFSVVGSREALALGHIEAAVSEIQRIEKLLTTYNDHSQTNIINANAGIEPVKVDDEVYQLIERSLRISHITDGYFDISYGGIDKTFWNFDREMKQLPDPELVKEHLKLINYKNIILDEKDQSVY